MIQNPTFQKNSPSTPTGYFAKWDQVTMPTLSGSNGKWVYMTYSEGRFLAISNTDKAAYSLNGETWDELTLSMIEIDMIAGGAISWTNVCNRICYGNGVYILSPREPETYIWYSTDGVNWNQATLPYKDTYTNVAYGNGVFVIIGSTTGRAFYSSDGQTWTAATLTGYLTGASGLIFDGTYFCFVTSGNKIWWYSSDGITWEFRQLPTRQTYTAIVYGNDVHVVLSSSIDHVVAFKPGQIESSDKYSTPSNQIYSLQTAAFDGKWFIAIEGGTGKNQTITSFNGASWRLGLTFPDSDGAISMAAHDGKTFAVGSSGQVYILVGSPSEDLSVTTSVNDETVYLFGTHSGTAVGGVYTGDGKRASDLGGGQEICLGFSPSAVFVSTKMYKNDTIPTRMAVKGCPLLSADSQILLQITENGFIAGEQLSTTSYVNADGVEYMYVAIR